jgi:3D (Asp-Asp-Asp) domain-containing protein
MKLKLSGVAYMKKKKKIKRKYLTKKRKKFAEENIEFGKFVFILFSAAIPLTFLYTIVYIDKSIPIKVPHPECGHLESTPPKRVTYIPSTAYSSTVDQTDSTPFITADGTYVHWSVVAANFLPFNTCIRFPEVFGNQFFVVHDRKHERFSNSFDIWFPEKAQAKRFGFRMLKTEIW